MSKQYPIIKASQMPSPRLQLRWEKLDVEEDGYTWFCHYELVMTIGPYDIRHHTAEDMFSGRSVERAIQLFGGTRVAISEGRLPISTDRIDAPRRDGAHIKWDAAQLGLRAFVVCNEFAMEIEPESQKA
jgi:hypothetical protein